MRLVMPYAPPKARAPIDLKLDGNEGAAPPAALLLELDDPELLRRYPDARSLERQLAARHGIDPERLLVTAGADDALDRACRALLGPGRKIIVPTPTFEMLPRYARLAGAELIEVPWNGGAYPTEAALAEVDDATAAIAVVSPNNPTGAVAQVADLQRLAEAAPHACLLVDCAYAEFADEDLTAAALALPDAVVLRTLSKAWGLAGLRVGYAMASVERAVALRASGHPYPVAAPSLALAEARLAMGGEDVARYLGAVRRERAALREALVELGCDAAPSQANFVLTRTPRAQWLRDGLAGLGIAVRSWSASGQLAGCLRITCPGDESGYARLEAALEAVMAPEALLFDMDGVLADVRDSYRRAIVDTASSYGVRLDDDDIARAKARGDANNDWRLTQRLLAERGVEAELDEVTARFEARYAELADRERLMVPRDTLEALARRRPLGIVTGRPRAQAQRFLDAQGIGALFEVVVAMEDAPAKPDPAPLRVALAGVGVSRAWMVGDTPDDVRAARGAAVVPLGFGPTADREALLDAGAARVLDDLEQLKELLS